MLTLRSLSIEDFGPYRGSQTIEFPSDRGVYIVYGPNGRGKTTLHNAFRYALYGEIRGRVQNRPALDAANTESRRDNGRATFKTVLRFDDDGRTFQLTRAFDESLSPSESVLLERDGVPLSQVHMKEVLATVAPLSVSQFFLFDGELLRQYEDLLDPESQEGAVLEQSIERVLGVPIVENALADIKEIVRKSQRQVAAQYAANEATRRTADSLTEAQDLREEYVKSRAFIGAKIQEAAERVSEIEALLRGQEKSQRLLGTLDALRAQHDTIKKKEQSAVEVLAEVVPALWKALLASDITAIWHDRETDVNDAQLEVLEVSGATRDLAHLAHDRDCPTCAREIDDALRAQLVATLQTRASDQAQTRAQDALEKAKQNLSVLDRLLDNNAVAISDRDKALRAVRLEAREVAEDIDATEDQLSTIDEDELRLLTSERDDRKGQITRDEERLTDAAKKISAQDAAIADLLRKLAKDSVKVDAGVELKQKTAEALSALFVASISAYRKRLKADVETNASRMFKTLSTEPDYVGLRITDMYGLEIIDEAGEVVKSRSAGYEHLVALSLIAALQDSAAVRGPVVMDYPFGRLDASNTSNVVAALPKMARQVILLAFDGEFDRNAALSALGGDLIAEYALVRVNSRNTRIEKRTVSNG